MDTRKSCSHYRHFPNRKKTVINTPYSTATNDAITPSSSRTTTTTFTSSTIISTSPVSDTTLNPVANTTSSITPEYIPSIDADTTYDTGDVSNIQHSPKTALHSSTIISIQSSNPSPRNHTALPSSSMYHLPTSASTTRNSYKHIPPTSTNPLHPHLHKFLTEIGWSQDDTTLLSQLKLTTLEAITSIPLRKINYWLSICQEAARYLFEDLRVINLKRNSILSVTLCVC